MEGTLSVASIGIRPRGPLDAQVEVPGSKSDTNRALVAAALARGESELQGALDADDTRAMRECLRADPVGAATAAGAGGELSPPQWSYQRTSVDV